MVYISLATILIAILHTTIATTIIVLPDDSNNTNGSFVAIAGIKSASSAPAGSCSCYCPSYTSSDSSSKSSGCFASDTLVTLSDNKQIPIHQLRPGHQILTTDGSTTFATQMIMMLDKNSASLTKFHTIITASGHKLSLTELHLITVINKDGSLNYIPARDVKIGDKLYVQSNEKDVISSPVTNLIIEMKYGYYAPLTTSGTLFVNGMMASCYANVQSHDAAHWYMGMFRWYYEITQFLSIKEPFGQQEADGIHLIPYIMYEFGRFFCPTSLRVV